MESATFYYSKPRAWIGTAFFALAVIILFGLTVAAGWDGPFTGITLTADMVMVTAFIMFLKKYSLPAVQGKPALVLDSEKLQFFFGNKTVYWRDIERISFSKSTRMTAIKLTMKGTEDDVMIGTRFIKGTDKEIFDAVERYFQQGS